MHLAIEGVIEAATAKNITTESHESSISKTNK
jgi:hypothetical protein